LVDVISTPTRCIRSVCCLAPPGGQCRRCAAEPRDEFAPFRLIELHSIPPAKAGLQDIELTGGE
jgi:hypothetical protein